MAIKDFGLLERISAEQMSPEEIRQLFCETALMTLSRATHADSHTSRVEVETVRAVYRRCTGEEVSAADVRVAASSDLFVRAPLEKWLASVASRLDETHRRDIAKALIEVIRVDGHIRPGEGDFFDMVAGALGLTPIDIVEICG